MNVEARQRRCLMLIALDYDGTYTADPDLWLLFITQAKQRGHQVMVVTMRNEFEKESVLRDLQGKVDRIILTDRKAKLPYMQKLGLSPDIWIDDQPHWLFEDAAG
jgi:hypothetical protein